MTTIEELAQAIRLAWHIAETGHESLTLEPWEKIGERRQRKWIAAAKKAAETCGITIMKRK